MNIFENTCPRCQKGEIFKSFLSMHKDCPQCQFTFEREPGYFTGALFINYMALALSSIPTLILFIVMGHPILAGIMCTLQLIILSPITLRLSRLAWIQMDFKSDPR